MSAASRSSIVVNPGFARMYARIYALLHALAFLLAALFGVAAQAQTWPVKPVRVLVNLPPGTPPDQIARAIAPRLGDTLGQPVVVENRVGAAGLIALEQTARAAPDGYTLLYTPGFPVVVGPHLFKIGRAHV